ncbi:hypothetical protein [Dactylosporangium sp. NPDC000521]|uniref:hypothetical protein n=1 Tax=Dactylosporangium sp. NPDC000521 TaxID=3363975 RepID=UPI0036B0A0C7
MTGQTRNAIIEGEIIGEPVNAPPPPPKPRKRWPWLMGGIATGVALCLAVPVAVVVTVFVLPLVRDTIEAGQGAANPNEALVRYQISFGYPGKDGEMLAARMVTGKRSKDILKTRADFLADRERDIARHPEWVWGEVKTGWAPEGQELISVHKEGDRADVTLWFSVGGHPNDGRTDGWYSSTLPWHAKAVRQRDGWRLTEVEIPTWCGTQRPDGTFTGYSKC